MKKDVEKLQNVFGRFDNFGKVHFHKDAECIENISEFGFLKVCINFGHYSLQTSLDP